MSCAVTPTAATKVGALTETMYTEHDIKILEFNERDVFADIGDEASEEGSGSYSIKPNRSDI